MRSKVLGIPDGLHTVKWLLSFLLYNPSHPVLLHTVVSLCNCTWNVSTSVRYDTKCGHAEVTSNYILACESRYALSVERRSCSTFSIFGINSTGAKLRLCSLLSYTFSYRTSSGGLVGESVCSWRPTEADKHTLQYPEQFPRFRCACDPRPFGTGLDHRENGEGEEWPRIYTWWCWNRRRRTTLRSV
jgi:hypothetical protein